MIIKKILNNNVAIALNSNKQECVVIGKGVAFGKQVGDNLDVTYAVKVFKSSGRGLAEKLSSIVEEIPMEHIKVCNEIVFMAREQLGQLDDKIYLTLIDHISFAIERQQKGMEFSTPFWNIDRLYPAEYAVGLRAIEIIDNRLGVLLPENEASFIAFHLLNANGLSMQNAREGVRLINGILEIVRSYFGITFDENSNSYRRFLTHLRFFSSRVISDEAPEEAGDQDTALSNLLTGLVEESSCVDEISRFVEKEFGHSITKEEKGYLIIHLHNIVPKSRT